MPVKSSNIDDEDDDDTTTNCSSSSTDTSAITARRMTETKIQKTVHSLVLR